MNPVSKLLAVIALGPGIFCEVGIIDGLFVYQAI